MVNGARILGNPGWQVDEYFQLKDGYPILSIPEGDSQKSLFAAMTACLQLDNMQ
jgi:hypothetical protein